jgi:hypothetical protein
MAGEAQSAQRSSGFAGLFDGSSVELVGVEDHHEGGIRCYLGHRANGVYCVMVDPEAIKRTRAAWAGGRRVLMPTPPSSCVFSDEEDQDAA